MEAGRRSGVLADSVSWRRSEIGHQPVGRRQRETQGAARIERWQGWCEMLVCIRNVYKLLCLFATKQDDKDEIDELDEWAGIQFTIDNETGELVFDKHLNKKT